METPDSDLEEYPDVLLADIIPDEEVRPFEPGFVPVMVWAYLWMVSEDSADQFWCTRTWQVTSDEELLGALSVQHSRLLSVVEGEFSDEVPESHEEDVDSVEPDAGILVSSREMFPGVAVTQLSPGQQVRGAWLLVKTVSTTEGTLWSKIEFGSIDSVEVLGILSGAIRQLENHLLAQWW